MLSPSRGFCYCLPVRLGALVVSFLACLGSAILAGVTFHSLAKISARITSVQTAGFYLTSLSWISLSLFSFIGFIAVILQHPLLLTIFARFIIYHIPANLLCNLFFTVVLFHFYREADVISRSPQCTRAKVEIASCTASATLATLTWVYLWILLPAAIAQTYIYVIIRRFIFFISGEWAAEQEHALEIKKRNEGKPRDNLKRRTTITHSIGHGGRRRARELWFTMETPSLEADESFLPSMVISPMAFQPPLPRSPFSISPRGLPPSPRPRFGDLGTGQDSPKSSLRPLLASPSAKEKDGASNRSAMMDMDFSDPDPVKSVPPPAQKLQPEAPPPPQHRKLPSRDKGKARESDASAYSDASGFW